MGAATNKNKELGAAVAPIRLIPKGQTAISVAGLHSYFGTIELASASNGLVVSNRISLERYLLGLQEVPSDWPAEALKAQAIAARTYALWTLNEGRTGDGAVYGYDICATVQCQVFSGADVVRSKDGDRWRAAVQATAGQAVLYGGEPILARYHSTSGGRTLDNEDAFEGEPAYPYLKSVPSPWEQGSSVFMWTVRFRLDRLTRILQHAGWWTHGRITQVTSSGPLFDAPFPSLSIRGVKGSREGGVKGKRVRTGMTAEDFRDAVRVSAPALYPSLYPSAAPTASGRLPETLPSHRFTIVTSGNQAIVQGRGWGHGSGMSQWGAHGLAQRGASYADILTHYYSGVSIGTVDQPPPFEVGLTTGASSVRATGSFEIVDGRGKTLIPRALGSWTFRWAGPGAVAIQPPAGYGLPLEVGIVEAPKKVLLGEPAYLTIALSRPAKVRTETASTSTGYEDPGVSIKDAGRRRVVWLAPLEEGTYKVRVQARAGPRAELSEPVEIVVTSASLKDPDPDVATDDSDEETGPAPALVALVLALVLALAVGGIARVRRSEEPNSKPPSE